MKKEILRMEHICVQNAGRLVLDDFHMNVYEGEFLFIYGFPDSGIRDLGKIFRGDCEVRKGRIFIDEKPVSVSSFHNPGQLGIYNVQIDNNLINDFTVAENLFFGMKRRYFDRTISNQKQEMMARTLLADRFDLDIDVSQKAGNVDIFDQIILKLVMAYARGAKLVVMDGIVGFIESGRAADLERVIKVLLTDGLSVLWLNQRMDYTRKMSDRIILLMQGKNVRTVYRGSEQTLDEVLEIGRIGLKGPEDLEMTGKTSDDDTVFQMDHLDSSWFSDLSLRICKGEIVGLCSSAIPAMAQWREIVCGQSKGYSGHMLLDQYSYQPVSYEESVQRGISYIDMMWYERHSNPDMSIEDNMMLGTWWKQKGMHGLLRKRVREHERVLYRIGHPGWPADRWGSLGADQQKILLLERMCIDPRRLIIITEPFYQIHQSQINLFCDLIKQIRDNNGAVVLMSASDYELKRVCDRIIYLDKWIRQRREAD